MIACACSYEVRLCVVDAGGRTVAGRRAADGGARAHHAS